MGILGVGTVGTGVARILLQERDLLESRTAVQFNLTAAADIDWSWDRGLDWQNVRLTDNPTSVTDDPEIDIIVETIGGCEPAGSLILRALRNRKHVVTANKALIATRAKELFSAAKEHQVDLLFEASVGGGIPIVKGLREGLVANKITRLYGILNGTSNYILTKMHEEGLEFPDALKQAQEKGFAEADPTLDISGVDAAHKLTILASLATSSIVNFENLYIEGIQGITALDISFAKNFGYSIKLLAICRCLDGKLDLRVHPTMVPNSHLLASVRNELNAIFVRGSYVGDTMFYGPGAGQLPTASAIVSDLVDLSRDLRLMEGEHFCNRTINTDAEAQIVPIEEISNRFYIRMHTQDRPGILSEVSGVLGREKISISSVVQLETQEQDEYVPVVILTHSAPEASMARALRGIREFPFIRGEVACIRLFSDTS
ncbi:MAG: homoserine dehydrogenase [Armatimonadota bacterium]